MRARRAPAARAGGVDQAEETRLSTLIAYGVLDTARNPALDDLVRLAARLYAAPMAAVILTDRNRQWIKSGHGFDLPEGPRGRSLTNSAIAEAAGFMIVEDAPADARFHKSPSLVGPLGIRFYASITLRAPDGQALGVLAVFDTVPRRMDAAELRDLRDLAAGVTIALSLYRLRREIDTMTDADRLTGLDNRDTFERATIHAVCDRSLPDPLNQGPAVLNIDLGELSTINDLYGQAQGDLLIQLAAQRLRALVREPDRLGRIAGDTFAVLLRHVSTAGQAEALAHTLLLELRQPFVLGQHRVSVDASVGIAQIGPDTADATELLRCADTALGHVKRSGRGRYWTYEPEMDVALDTRRKLERELRVAVEHGQFKLRFQPIADTLTGSVRAFEALIRWDRPGHGPCPPGDFIPVAEASGLIRNIDEWVLRTACAEALRWEQPVGVCVNVSAETFASGGLPRLVGEVLRITGLKASRLELELTERSVLRPTEAARADINRLRTLGVRLALDDFGTGYASLSTLDAFPLDKIKLDRSFVSGIGERRSAEAIVCSVLQLGRALHLPICAEGVETQAQLSFLREHGCPEVQGYLLGRPGVVGRRAMLPSDAFASTTPRGAAVSSGR